MQIKEGKKGYSQKKPVESLIEKQRRIRINLQIWDN